MAIRCDWCGTEISDPSGAAVRRCARCGHRADLPRPICDCSVCAARRSRGQTIDWTSRDREQVTAYAADRIARAVAGALRTSPSVATARRLGLLTFEDWSRRYRRNINADPVLHRSFRALSALGVDVTVVLRKGYEAGRESAGNPQ